MPTSGQACPEVVGTPVPERWRGAALLVREAVDNGRLFLSSFIAAGVALDELRTELSAQGARNDLRSAADRELGWTAGCQEYLGFSYKTAERWIIAAKELAFMRLLASGEMERIPANTLTDGFLKANWAGPLIAVRDDLRDQASLRLEAVATGDCSPYRAMAALAGAITGGITGNPTGRRPADPAQQLLLDFEDFRPRAAAIRDAWHRWTPEKQLQVKDTLQELLTNLPDSLRAEARRWLS